MFFTEEKTNNSPFPAYTYIHKLTFGFFVFFHLRLRRFLPEPREDLGRQVKEMKQVGQSNQTNVDQLKRQMSSGELMEGKVTCLSRKLNRAKGISSTSSTSSTSSFEEPKQERNQEPKQERIQELKQELKQEPKQERNQERIQKTKQERNQELKKEPKQERNQEPKQERIQERIQKTKQERNQEPKQELKQEPKQERNQELKQDRNQKLKQDKRGAKQDPTQGGRTEESQRLKMICILSHTNNFRQRVENAKEGKHLRTHSSSGERWSNSSERGKHVYIITKGPSP